MTARVPPYRGRRVAVERRPNGRWRVGQTGIYGIADPAETIDLRIGELSDSPYDQPEERRRCLKELAEQQQRDRRGYLLAWLVEELDEVIAHFHGPVPQPVTTPVEVMAMARQAALCRAWLDFLQGQADFQIGQLAARTMLLLWRRYCRVLTELYELDGTSEALDDATWKALSSWQDLEGEYRRALNYWSRVLLDPDNESSIASILSEESENPAGSREKHSLDRPREQAVEDLIWLPQGGLRQFFRTQPEGHRFLDRLARGWFLPRYDLPSVSRLIRDQIRAGGGPRWLGWIYRSSVGMPWLLVELSALLLMAGVWLGSASSAQVAGAWVIWSALGIAALVTRLAWPLVGIMGLVLLVADWSLATGSLVWSYGLVVLGTVGALLSVFCVLYAIWRLGRSALYPFSIRLAAGTFVGLVALSGLSDQFADFTFKALCTAEHPCGWVGSLLLLGISLAAALIYMFSDALNQVNDRRLAWQRSWRLFRFGWAQSTLFAAATSWLAAGRAIPTHLPGTPGPCRVLPVWLGGLYPDYLLSAGVLALVVGVLTQIMWEDRPIPGPL